MNMTIGIRLKIDARGLQQKCFSGDFPQLLELRLLRTHIGGCSFADYSQSISEKPMRWSPFKVKLPENVKNSYFPKRDLHVYLPFGLRVTFIFPQEYQKV